MPHQLYEPADPDIVWTLPQPYISDGFDEMRRSIQEDFGGIGMRHHRVDLIKRLDHVLKKIDLGRWYFIQHNPEFDEGSSGENEGSIPNTQRDVAGGGCERDLSCVSSNEHTPLYTYLLLRAHAEPRTTFMCALPLPRP